MLDGFLGQVAAAEHAIGRAEEGPSKLLVHLADGVGISFRETAAQRHLSHDPHRQPGTSVNPRSRPDGT